MFITRLQHKSMVKYSTFFLITRHHHFIFLEYSKVKTVCSRIRIITKNDKEMSDVLNTNCSNIWNNIVQITFRAIFFNWWMLKYWQQTKIHLNLKVTHFECETMKCKLKINITVLFLVCIGLNGMVTKKTYSTLFIHPHFIQNLYDFQAISHHKQPLGSLPISHRSQKVNGIARSPAGGLRLYFHDCIIEKYCFIYSPLRHSKPVWLTFFSM